MALGDPLRAERQVHLEAARGEVLGDVGGGPRVDGAPEDDQRAAAKVRGDLLDGPLEHRHRRAEELVDRRADHDDDLIRPRRISRRRGQLEPAGRQDAGQQLVGAVLAERHLARGDPVEGRLARVVDADSQARVGEREAERQADMATAPEDDEVEIGSSDR